MGNKKSIDAPNSDVYCYNDNGYLEIKSTNGNKLLELQLSATNLRALIGSDLDVVYRYENSNHKTYYYLKENILDMNYYYVRLNGDIRKIYVDFSKLSKQ